MKTPQELRAEASRIEQQQREKKQSELRKKRDDFEQKHNMRIYTSDDYCGLELKKVTFYYGYEEALCPFHKLKDCECDEKEWCFVVKEKGKETTRIPKSKLHPEADEEPFWYLVAGIGHWLGSKNDEIKKGEM